MNQLAVLCLIFSSLTYQSQTWFFTGQVQELRQERLYGMPVQFARVQAADFETWVILRVETLAPDSGYTAPIEAGTLVLGEAQPGDLVRVSLRGAHVGKNGVDWSLCQQETLYCRTGRFLDDGLPALDWGVPLSPSNQLIHTGRPSSGWESALFWKTEIIEHARAAPVSLSNPIRLCPGCQRHLSFSASSPTDEPADLAPLAPAAVARGGPACLPR
jgi:hypothetical protein